MITPIIARHVVSKNKAGYGRTGKTDKFEFMLNIAVIMVALLMFGFMATVLILTLLS